MVYCAATRLGLCTDAVYALCGASSPLQKPLTQGRMAVAHWRRTQQPLESDKAAASALEGERVKVRTSELVLRGVPCGAPPIISGVCLSGARGSPLLCPRLHGRICGHVGRQGGGVFGLVVVGGRRAGSCLVIVCSKVAWSLAPLCAHTRREHCTSL